MTPSTAVLIVAGLIALVVIARKLGYRSRRDSYRLGVIVALGVFLAGAMAALFFSR